MDLSKQEYESALKKLVSTEVEKVFAKNNEAIIDRHNEIVSQITELTKKITPIIGLQTTLESIDATYRTATDFSRVASWLFKNIIIPTSVIAGIWFSLKQVLK